MSWNRSFHLFMETGWTPVQHTDEAISHWFPISLFPSHISPLFLIHPRISLTAKVETKVETALASFQTLGGRYFIHYIILRFSR